MPHIIPVFISYAGCPHRCAFCSQHDINGETEFSLARARGQIERYLSFLPADSEKDIAFYGGSFTGLPENTQTELLDLAAEYKRDGIIADIRLSTRPDYINDNAVKLLLRYDVRLVELGAQSLDDKVLEYARRGHDAAAIVRAARLLRSAGISFGLQLMIGLPGQDWDSVRSTVGQVVKIAPKVVRIYPLLLFAGTQFADDFSRGLFQPLSLTGAVEQAAYMVEAFEEAGIKIIRIGLQEDDGLRAEGAVLAGPYHPAFGELVASHRYKIWFKKEFSALSGARTVKVLLSEKEMSKVYGHKKANIIYLKKNYPQHKISFQVADVDRVRMKICI